MANGNNVSVVVEVADDNSNYWTDKNNCEKDDDTNDADERDAEH